VPNVLGESGRAGEINVRRRGLEVTTAVAHLPGLPADQVVAQSPPPDSGVLLSPRVDLLITAPEEDQSMVMPDLTGHRVAEAAKQLEDAGLKLGGSLNPTGTLAPLDATQKASPGAVVLHQSPAAGQKISPGDTVVLELAHD
ncbi:MAG TPA: PASTA domain-containing protein, partial [Terriglobales bacterium]|nr:PASTA domain-containing protein [Terriglobales bacterium]